MKSQHYKIPTTFNSMINTRVGQFVYKNNNIRTNKAVGLIYRVGVAWIEIISFSHTEVPENGININATLNKKEFTSLINNIIGRTDEAVKEEWDRLEIDWGYIMSNPYDNKEAESNVVEFVSTPSNDHAYESLARAYVEKIKESNNKD